MSLTHLPAAPLADFRRHAGVPISVSEMILRRSEFQQVLSTRAADRIQLDRTWCGGISETARLGHLAEGYNRPLAEVWKDCVFHEPRHHWRGSFQKLLLQEV